MKISQLAFMFFQALAHKLVGKRTPLVVSISITSRCNLTCTYCYSYEDNENAHEVPAEELFSTIDRLYAMGTRVIMLQGGEPLMHRRIDDIIAHVKGKGMYCSVTTNALLFERHLASLKTIDQVQLSLDGGPELTEQYRGKKVYDAVVSAIRLCDEHKIPFHIHSVICDNSDRENALDPLIELARKYHTYLNFCVPGIKSDDLARNREHIRNFYTMLVEEKKSGNMPCNTSINTLESIVDWGAEYDYEDYIPADGEHNGKYQKCVMGDLVAWLDSTGRLHPCAVHFGEEGFHHSIHEHGIEGAWDRLNKLPCHYCSSSSEFNHLFNLRPEALINALKFAKGSA